MVYNGIQQCLPNRRQAPTRTFSIADAPLNNVLAPRKVFTMRLISRTQLRDKINQWEDIKLVFVLGEWQYQSMRIPGSLNVPCSPDLFGSRDALKELGPDDEIVVYCSGEACYASISVYYLLVQRGYKNVSRYAGGLLDWKDAGYPIAGGVAVPEADSIPC